EKDIMDAFVDVLGFYTPGVRLVINVPEDRKGVLEEITDFFAEAEISIQQIAVYRKDHIQIVIQVDSDDVTGIQKNLEAQGYNVESIMYKDNQ
ncbi:ACT domain-containing protein, partial [Jeotgalibaca porci]